MFSPVFVSCQGLTPHHSAIGVELPGWDFAFLAFCFFAFVSCQGQTPPEFPARVGCHFTFDFGQCRPVSGLPYFHEQFLSYTSGITHNTRLDAQLQEDGRDMDKYKCLVLRASAHVVLDHPL
jgi:hypothetical protein